MAKGGGVKAGGAGGLGAIVSRLGLANANYLRSGMRDLTQHRGAYEGATPAEVKRIAASAAPAKNSGKAFEPVRVSVETDRGERKVILRDGRHRMTAAREAGATHVLADVTQYGPRGGVVARWRGKVKI